MYERYGDSDSYTIQKVRIEVEIQIEGGQTMLGSFFGAPKQRVADILNDERGFLPFEASSGVLVMLKKSALLTITPLNQANRAPARREPYEILGVAKAASDEELKEAYHRVSRATHPDRLIAMGLPKEFVQLANERMALINDAYARIVKDRESRNATAPRAQVA